MTDDRRPRFDGLGIALLGLAAFITVMSAISGQFRAPVPDNADAVQQSMAWANWVMVWVTVAAGAIGALSLYLIYRTLLEAKRSADAAMESAKHAAAAIAVTQRMGEAQMRAYMTLSGATITIPPSHHPRVKLFLTNSGQTPAKTLSLTVRARLEDKATGEWVVVKDWEHTEYLAEMSASGSDTLEVTINIAVGSHHIAQMSRRTGQIVLEGEIKYKTVFAWSDPTRFQFRTLGQATTNWEKVNRMHRIAEKGSHGHN